MSLKIKDKSGKVKYILGDDDTEPHSTDDLVLKEGKKLSQEERKKENAPS